MNVANVADARVFGVALVILGIAFAVATVLELSWRQLTPATRAAVVAAGLFLIGGFLEITIATSGWASSPLSKSYWSIVVIAMVLTPLVRALRPVDLAKPTPTAPATISAYQPGFASKARDPRALRRICIADAK